MECQYKLEVAVVGVLLNHHKVVNMKIELRLLCISLLILALAAKLCSVRSQTYIPRAVPRTTCSSGVFRSYGQNNVSLLAVKRTSSGAPGSYIHTRRFNGTSGTIITQLSYGIFANTITSVTMLRLALFLVDRDALTVVGQTEEISLYTTSADIIYADLLQPVTLHSAEYAIGAWHSASIFTAADLAPMTPNTPFKCYTCESSDLLSGSYGYAQNYGERALAAHGCTTTHASDPYTAPNTDIYSICVHVQWTTPAPNDPTFEYRFQNAAVTTTVLLTCDCGRMHMIGSLACH